MDHVCKKESTGKSSNKQERSPKKLKCQTFKWKTGLADFKSTNHQHLKNKHTNTLTLLLSYGMELRDTGMYGFILPPDQIIPTGQEVVLG